MDYREQVAHHEAAHAVLAIRYNMGISGGIDLDAATSVDGAFGNAAVNLIVLDAELPIKEQRLDLARNLAVVCAGAASDARVKQIAPGDALDAQPGDYRFAVEAAMASSLVADPDEADYVVKEVGLSHAVAEIAKPDVWAVISRVAAAVLDAGGRLSQADIEALAIAPSSPR